jgi:hypothetical protein
MENQTQLFKYKFKYIFYLGITYLLVYQHLNAQSLERAVIGAAGEYRTSTFGSMEWTIGEVITDTYINMGHSFTQGFHQPNTIEIVSNPTDLFIPEGFSPNIDGINDLFVIKGIENYSANKIEIYNRWGQKVFEAKPYTNNWDGKSQSFLNISGDQLPVGTYFYILELGNGSSIYKGTIYLNK